jgi:hypothetical protein
VVRCAARDPFVTVGLNGWLVDGLSSPPGQAGSPVHVEARVAHDGPTWFGRVACGPRHADGTRPRPLLAVPVRYAGTHTVGGSADGSAYVSADGAGRRRTHACVSRACALFNALVLLNK